MNRRVIREVYLVGLLAVMFGLIILLAVALLYDPSPANGEWVGPVAKLLENIGVSAIVFGVFNIMIGIPDWSRYFEKRLQNLVLDSGYLKSLSGEQLRVLQRRLIKATFNNDNVEKEGSFLHFFDRHLHPYLGLPYRENVRATMMYTEAGESFIIHDSMTYVLREGGGRVQDRVVWQNDANEIEEVLEVRISVRFPDATPRAGDTVELRQIRADEATGKRELRVECSLEEYSGIDGLIVEVDSQYRVNKSRFQSWEMPCSTRNFALTIMHPASYRMSFKAYVHNPELTRSRVMPGCFHFECESWMLANSGVAWRLEPQEMFNSGR